MIVLRSIAETREAMRDARAGGGRVGFVPTMGALHDGHRALVRRARDENDTVVVSIFVNPAQFGPHEDLDAYPRPEETDLAVCRADGVDVVFHPSVPEMYPRRPLTSVRVSGVSEPLEGACRPGHFDGVALVVVKLLNIVGPCRAYFGRKDAQQLAVVRTFVDDLDIPAEIVACPTVRDADGLAMSSRNAYLSDGERRRALALPKALHAVAAAAGRGEKDVPSLLTLGRSVLDAGRPDAVDYLDCVDPDTFRTLERLGGPALVCGAIRVGGTRLIDNVLV